MSVPDTDVTPLASAASRALNEAVMGFLALVALATAVGPLVFDVSSATDRLLTAVEWVVLGLFIAEFVVQYIVARDRSSWLRSPWRIVDAVCIVGPLLSLLPQVSDTVRGALVFRFLRIGRAVAFGARAGALAVRKRQESGLSVRGGITRVTVMEPGETGPPRGSSWKELLAWAGDVKPAWYHASNVGREQFLELLRVNKIPIEDVVDFHGPSGQPLLKNFPQNSPGRTSLCLWLPTVVEGEFPAVERNRVVAIVSKTWLLTASWGPLELPEEISSAASGAAQADVTFPVQMVYDILTLVRERNEFVARRHEEEIFRLEEDRATQGGAQFLNKVFRLEREIAAAAADVWRLKEIVLKLAGGKVTVHGADTKNDPFLGNLLSSLEVIHDKFVELKESLRSLMELHMNVTSFEMNKFMKLLAIVGFLGLIPSVAGGLLGMNVAGNPWSVTLPQVAFGIGMGMAIALYVFAIKGWLR
jgi:Mg2+ and Co2+ transporter CorA